MGEGLDPWSKMTAALCHSSFYFQNWNLACQVTNRNKVPVLATVLSLYCGSSVCNLPPLGIVIKTIGLLGDTRQEIDRITREKNKNSYYSIHPSKLE